MSERSPRLNEADILALGLRLALADELGEREADGLKLADGEIEVLALGLREALGELLWEAEGELEELGERELETLALGLREALGLIEALGLKLALALVLGLKLAEGLSEALGEPLALALGDEEADGEVEAEGEILGLAPDTAAGAVPYQLTPGRGPGCPSSYKKILLASWRASTGNRDLSIKVITPRLKLDKVSVSGLGNFLGPLGGMVRGIF